jgi:hypothetical protein
MARDLGHDPGFAWSKGAGKREWPMTRVTDGATIFVTNRQTFPDGSSTVEDSDTGELYKLGPKQGQVEPIEES